MIDDDRSEVAPRDLETLLVMSLEKVGDVLEKQDVEDIRQYIDQGEYGVGWELLWHLVTDKKLTAPVELVESGKIMKFDVTTKG